MITATAAAALALAGCSGSANPSVPAQSQPGSAAATPSAPAPTLTIPSATAGELARVTVSDGAVTAVRSEKPASSAAGYFVEGACVSSAGGEMTYRLSVGGGEVSTGVIACDGATYKNTAADVSAGAEVDVALDAPPADVTQGFVRVVPS